MADQHEPQLDYLLCEEIKPETGVVTTSDIADHWQKYKVLAAGKGRYDHGVFIEVSVKPGDIIYVQKHSEADSPPELVQRGQALIMASRVMDVIKNES